MKSVSLLVHGLMVTVSDAGSLEKPLAVALLQSKYYYSFLFLFLYTSYI